MVTLTENAASVIRALVDRPELGEEAGLRVASPSNGTQGFVVSTAPSPQAGDAVVDDEGARVFLEQAAAVALEDKVLDARVNDEGGVEFLLALK